MPVPDAHHPLPEHEPTSSSHDATPPQDSKTKPSTSTPLPSIGADDPDDTPRPPSPTDEPGGRVPHSLPPGWYLPFAPDQTRIYSESEEDYFYDHDWVREMEGEAGVHWVLRAIIEEDYYIPYFAHRDAQRDRRDAGETREKMEDIQAALGGEMEGPGLSDDDVEEEVEGQEEVHDEERNQDKEVGDDVDGAEEVPEVFEEKHTGSGDEETSEPDAPSQAFDQQDTGSGDEEFYDAEELPEASKEQDARSGDEQHQATGDKPGQPTENEPSGTAGDEAIVEEHNNPDTIQQPPVAPLTNHQTENTPAPTPTIRPITCGSDLVTPAEQPFRFLSGNQRRFHLHAHVDVTQLSYHLQAKINYYMARIQQDTATTSGSPLSKWTVAEKRLLYILKVSVAAELHASPEDGSGLSKRQIHVRGTWGRVLCVLLLTWSQDDYLPHRTENSIDRKISDYRNDTRNPRRTNDEWPVMDPGGAYEVHGGCP